MSDKSTENYLDNLLDSMNKLQDTDTKMSGADQDEFLKKFEDELENETYDEYLSNFEKELERENEQAKGQALNVQTPAPDDKDASLDDMLTEFDRRMKEQETQGDKQENKADNNLSDAVFNFTPADSGIEMMDANMPEMAENPKQEETPESIITNEPQMVEEIGEPDLAGNASKDILDILGSDGLDNIGDLLEGKTGETGADIDDYASSQMKVHETADAAVDAQDTEKKSLLKRIISFFTKEPQSDDVTDIQSTAEGAETDAKTLSDENKQILEALDADGELNEATDKPKKGKKPKKEKKPKKPKKEKKPKAPKEKKERMESVKVLGLVNITVLAAGSIFTGTVHEPIKGTKNPQKMLQCGVPFTKKPVALQFDYKVKMSDRENRIRATGFSKITDVPGKDYPAAILFLQKRWEDANGNVYAKRIGTMVTYYYHSTDWKNNASYEIMYGDITGRPEYKAHMMRLQVTENYTVNSKGESVPIHEVAWGNEDDVPTHIYIQFTSSHGGAYIGSPGNSLWVDNVKLVY